MPLVQTSSALTPVLVTVGILEMEHNAKILMIVSFIRPMIVTQTLPAMTVSGRTVASATNILQATGRTVMV